MESNRSVLLIDSPPTHRTATPAAIAAWLGVIFAGGIFGFFYAWVCSTMWGLDQADPRVAIAAMQAMNGSVRNAVFFPAFFLTPAVLAVAAGLALRERRVTSAQLLALAAATYLFGGLLLTATINVPMNEALGATPVPTNLDEAQRLWSQYSSRWQRYNQLRTVASGIALGLAAAALLTFSRVRHSANR